MNSKEKYLEIVKLRNRSGETIYQRIVYARDLLADKEWVHDPTGGGGDESKAIDRLEEFGFADVCGAMSLVQMLDLLRTVPSRETWEQHRYNLRRLWAEKVERKKLANPPKPKNPPVPGQDAKDRKIAELTMQLRAKEERIRALEKELYKMRTAMKKIQDAQKMLEE